MSKILCIEGQELSPSLRAALIKTLRTCDEATVLPQATHSAATGVYKNIAFRLDANEPDAPLSVFSPAWFSGVSAVEVTGTVASRIVNDPSARAKAMQALRFAIPSETFDPDLTVGPELDGDATDCDKDRWECGFDSSACFCGLFAATHSRAPTPTAVGQNRSHERVYLVVKAGAGLAAATFHARLLASLKQHKSLHDCLEAAGSSPGPAALRRVARAGSRNRARILKLAGEALGLEVDSAPDQSSKGAYRLATCCVDVSSNTIRRLDEKGINKYQVSLACDAVASKGLVSLSNLADGVVMFLSSTGDTNFVLRNEAWSTLPLSTPRLKSDKDVLEKVCAAHRADRARRVRIGAHEDDAFLRDKFTWRNREFGGADEPDFEPLALWGSHATESFFSSYARELGVAACQVVKLLPAAVCVAGLEGGQIRAALRTVRGA